MRLAVSVTFMFREVPFLERFALARKEGFGAVEIQVLDATAQDAAQAAADAGLTIALLNVGMGDFTTGGAGLAGVPGREAEYCRAFADSLETAAALGAQQLFVGPSRIPGGQSQAACRDSFHRNMERCLPLAAQAGVPLLLEAMNPIDMPDALFTDIEETASFLRAHYPGQIGLQFDLYHVARAGEDIGAALQRHVDIIRHVQFADAPSHAQPGTGSTDFAAAFAALSATSYDGWIAAEYLPQGPTMDSFGWLQADWARALTEPDG